MQRLLIINFCFIIAVQLWGCGGKESGTTNNDSNSEKPDSATMADSAKTNINLPEKVIGTEDIDMAYNDFKTGGEMNEVSDKQVVRSIFDEVLLNGKCYELLDYLSNKIGGRLSGSPQAAAAVEWAFQTLDTMGIERVWKQSVMVPRWQRGNSKEVGRILNSRELGTFEVPVCALGGSVGTGEMGISAPIIEVRNFQELKKLGQEKVKGKIVFFNRRMDPRFINTFYAYGNCVNQRWGGAMEAAKLGAVGCVVRSMSLSMDDYPHTGSMGYEEGIEKIPAMSISTNGARKLSQLLKREKNLRFYMKQQPKTLPDVLSYNVVGEIKGSEYPDEIVLVGGHLDSWDLGDGAHDDGAGCVQSMEVLRIFKEMGIRPKRTIRCVLFMNEENGLRGGKKYAEIAKLRNEKHIAAIETDRGGFAPRYFTVEGANEAKFNKQYAILRSWLPILQEYGIQDFKQGGSGADIGPLKPQETLLFGLVPESQRYFDFHHSERDVFETVNKRELELGAGAMASLIYLISENGI